MPWTNSRVRKEMEKQQVGAPENASALTANCFVGTLCSALVLIGEMFTHCVLLLCLASFWLLESLFNAIFMFEVVLILLGRCQYFWINIKKVLVYRNADLFFLLGLKSHFKMAKFHTEWIFPFLWEAGTRSQNRCSCPTSTLFSALIAPSSAEEDGNLLLHCLLLLKVQEGPWGVRCCSSCCVHLKSASHRLTEWNQNS